MDPKEPEELIEQSSVAKQGAGLEAEEYVRRELVRTRKALRISQIGSILFILLVIISIGGITAGFARSLEPNEAATITKGLVDERVNEQIPQFRQYIKEKIPTFIAQVPAYVKKQLPMYRTKLEAQLETNLDQYVDQSSQQLQGQFDTFLTTNQAGVKALLGSSQDPAALKAFDKNLRTMFVDYIDTTEVNGVTLRAEVDQTLDALGDIDTKMKRLARNKGLTDDEKKTRKAIAILLKSVDTNSSIADARTAVDSFKQNGAEQFRGAVQGLFQYDAAGEATFTAPGKAPVAVILKKSPPVASPKSKSPSSGQGAAHVVSGGATPASM